VFAGFICSRMQIPPWPHFPGAKDEAREAFPGASEAVRARPNLQNENPPGRATTGAGRDLACPAHTNRAFEHKRQFPGLSSPRRFAFRVAPLHALVAEEEVRADPVEVFRLRCHSRAKLWHDGEIDLHSAVDELQHAAEASGLIDAIGQAAAHGLLAAVLAPVC
jgi:hypothetical protein